MSKMENTNISHLKHEIPKDNLQIAEWTNDISIAGEIYS